MFFMSFRVFLRKPRFEISEPSSRRCIRKKKPVCLSRLSPPPRKTHFYAWNSLRISGSKQEKEEWNHLEWKTKENIDVKPPPALERKKETTTDTCTRRNFGMTLKYRNCVSRAVQRRKGKKTKRRQQISEDSSWSFWKAIVYLYQAPTQTYTTPSLYSIILSLPQAICIVC